MIRKESIQKRLAKHGSGLTSWLQQLIAVSIVAVLCLSLYALATFNIIPRAVLRGLSQYPAVGFLLFCLINATSIFIVRKLGLWEPKQVREFRPTLDHPVAPQEFALVKAWPHDYVVITQIVIGTIGAAFVFTQYELWFQNPNWLGLLVLLYFLSRLIVDQTLPVTLSVSEDGITIQNRRHTETLEWTNLELVRLTKDHALDGTLRSAQTLFRKRDSKKSTLVSVPLDKENSPMIEAFEKWMTEHLLAANGLLDRQSSEQISTTAS